MLNIHFYPQNSSDNDCVSDETLWMMTYKKSGQKNEYLVEFLEKRIGIAYPLSFWLERINCYDEINYGVDYPYKKYLVFYNDSGQEYLNITLTALDVNAENHSCTHSAKNAGLLLKFINLPLEGSMHPEKFYYKLKAYCELIAYDIKQIEGLKVMLSSLEELCEHCVKYESPIEWKIIGTES